MIRRFLRSRRPSEVGRQKMFGAAILDTAAWLATHGWGDVRAGDRQVYASYLLEMRDRYERVRAS